MKQHIPLIILFVAFFAILGYGATRTAKECDNICQAKELAQSYQASGDRQYRLYEIHLKLAEQNNLKAQDSYNQASYYSGIVDVHDQSVAKLEIIRNGTGFILSGN